MSILKFAPVAEDDLDGIGDYIAEDSPEASGRVVEKITNTCRMLSQHPFSGRLRNELVQDMRSFPVGSYVVFYDVIPDGIEVVRVLHGARDFHAIFKS